MKVVLDTNVLLAAFGTRGLCEAVVELVLAFHQPVSSEPLIAETLGHLAGKFKMPPARVAEIEQFIRAYFVVVEPARVRHDACRDPDDLVVLGTAVAARADCIVSGDKDLLSLGQYDTIPILSPRGFYEALP